MKKYIFYIFVLALFIIFAKLFTNALIKTKKEGFVYAEKSVIDIAYKTTIDLHKEQSNAIFENIINKPEILEVLKDINTADDNQKDIIRKKLYAKLLPLYENIKQKHFKQLHFHLKDNTSFLRFHRPEVYGDDLSKVRVSVVAVNKTLKPAFGFEEGKIYNGYRFVYPLIYKGVHLGSVETSISVKAVIDAILKQSDADIKFMIRKSVVDDKLFKNEQNNYIQCEVLKDFLHEKDINFKSETPAEQLVLKDLAKMDLEDKLLKGYEVSSVNEIYGTYYVSIFYPIKNFISNKTVAYLVYYDEHKEIKKYIDSMNILFMLFVISSCIICYYVFKLNIANQELIIKEKKIEELNTQLNQKYKNQKSMLIHQSRLAQMGEMFSMIVHQIKQPLNSYSLNTDMLSYLYEYEPENKKEIAQLKDTIRKVTLHTNETIDNFRNFYNTDKEKKEYKLEDVVNESLFVLDQKIKFNRINIDKFIDEEIVLNTFNNQLKQVVVAITSNAIDALTSQEDRNIQIKTYKENDKAIIEIIDNGPGIPKEIKQTVFDAYFTTKAHENGTGLGLYMSKMIVEDSLKGELSFTSSENGTTFKIELSNT